MLSINVSPSGEINISQESADERKSLAELYHNQDIESSSPETDRDEMNAAFFKQGWDMCLAEVQMNFAKGRLVEFFQEIGADPLVETKSEDPHHDEPEGTGEHLDDVPAAAWGESTIVLNFEEIPDAEDVRRYAAEVTAGGATLVMNIGHKEGVSILSPEDQEAAHAANEIGLDVIRPVENSGEPEKEEYPVDDVEPGTWTISNAELNSRINAAYNRGYEQKAIFDREAGYREGFANGQTVAKQTTQRSLDIIAVEINAQVLQWWEDRHADADDKPVISKGDYAREFARNLATRLGYEVSA